MPESITAKTFSQKLISWYQLHKRKLPWRDKNEAYEVWLSEILLQQTRIAQGLPYYERFLSAFPTIQHLARATEQDVLRLWQGLGYYRRGINLLRCAKEIVDKYDGVFPQSYEALCTLPGIGPYTAAAIASIAFGKAVAVVDGNVYRVLARVFGIELDIGDAQAPKQFSKRAQSLLDEKQPGTFNQALMEFGALHCTPMRPSCHNCIFQDVCVAKQKNLQDKLPVKRKKPPLKNRYFHYLVLTYKNTLYFKQRKQKDIWHGLYDFYLIERDRFYTFDDLKDDLVSSIQAHGLLVRKLPPHYKHLLTHQRIHVAFFHIEINDALYKKLQGGLLRPFSRQQVKELPLPILLVNFLKHRPSITGQKTHDHM